MFRIGAAKRATSLLALVAIAVVGGLASQDTHASARGNDQAFMGNWETEVVSINEDSWVFGGPSPLLDIVLEGDSELRVLTPGRGRGVLRNSEVRWHAIDDFTEMLAWMEEPESTRGPRPCAVRLSGDGVLTAGNGDEVHFEAVWGSACPGDERGDRIRGLWEVVGGTGQYQGATGWINTWGFGGGGVANEVVFGWIDR